MQFLVNRAMQCKRFIIMHGSNTLLGGLGGHITGQTDYGYTALVDGMLNSRLQHTGCLCWCLDKLIVATAIVEKFYCIGFLMVVCTKFTGVYGRSDGDYGCSGPVCVIKPINEVYMPGSRTTRTTANSIEFSLCCRSVGAHFFMSHMYPFYISITPYSIV